MGQLPIRSLGLATFLLVGLTVGCGPNLQHYQAQVDQLNSDIRNKEYSLTRRTAERDSLRDVASALSAEIQELTTYLGESRKDLDQRDDALFELRSHLVRTTTRIRQEVAEFLNHESLYHEFGGTPTRRSLVENCDDCSLVFREPVKNEGYLWGVYGIFDAACSMNLVVYAVDEAGRPQVRSREAIRIDPAADGTARVEVPVPIELLPGDLIVFEFSQWAPVHVTPGPQGRFVRIDDPVDRSTNLDRVFAKKDAMEYSIGALIIF